MNMQLLLYCLVPGLQPASKTVDSSAAGGGSLHNRGALHRLHLKMPNSERFVSLSNFHWAFDLVAFIYLFVYLILFRHSLCFLQ